MVEEPQPEDLIISVDSERCIRCLECVDVCPQSEGTEFPVYERAEDGMPRVANPDNCIACLSCVAQCRAMAIDIEGRRAGKLSYEGGVEAENKRRSMF